MVRYTKTNNPCPHKWLGIIWNIWKKVFIIMMLVTMFWRLRQNLGVSWGGWVPIDAFEGGGSVGSFNLPSPSRCLMLPVLVLASVTKESDEQTPVGNCSLYKSSISSYSLFPPCCPNAVQYQLCHSFSLSLWNQSVPDLFTMSMKRDVERENTATCHSLLRFTWDRLTFEQFHIITLIKST